jgi:hypothetical protein
MKRVTQATSVLDLGKQGHIPERLDDCNIGASKPAKVM